MRTRLISILLQALPFAIAAAGWEGLALSGRWPAILVPDLGTIATTFFDLAKSGVLVSSSLGTLARLFSGFFIAAAFGMTLGLVMGRFKFAEDCFLPIVTMGYPIPTFAYAGLFVLWFGLGNTPSILLVAIAAIFPITINTWKGIKAVKRIWLRSAVAMGANQRDILLKVVLPASLPYSLIGLRLGLAQAWRTLIGVEMLTAVSNGLGSLIFGAIQFLNTDVMLSGVGTIAIVGFVLERLAFEPIERRTLFRWGMVSS